MTDQNNQRMWNIFNSLDSMITNHAIRIGVIKGALNKKNFLFAIEIELNLKRKLKSAAFGT
jgi:hypothetical protein